MQKADRIIKKEGYLEESYHYFHLRDTAGQERDYHFHEFDKIVILLSGHVDYAVENDVFSLKPWDILLVRHHTIHKAIIDKSEPYDRIIIYLNEGHFSTVMPEAELTKCFSSSDSTANRLLSPDPARQAEIRSLLECYERYSAAENRYMCETVIMQLLIVLSGISSECSIPDPGFSGKIESTLSYINENLASELSVDELAARLYLSRYHFMRIFKKATGTSVHIYIRQRRLLNASRLIREGAAAADAARLSGFDDYSAFYRAFKENFGFPPSRLKK